MKLSKLPLALAVAFPFTVGFAHAATITWTTWNFPSVGSTPGNTPADAGMATGMMGGIAVTYVGQNENTTSVQSYYPLTTFTGGTIGNAPVGLDAVKLMGGVSYTETVSFSTPVVDPVMAIWSLGSDLSGVPIIASFVFTPSEPFTIETGGPSAEYPLGTSIYRIGTNGTTVYGDEGSGVIQFNGLYSSLSFTTPDYEDFYTFTVGHDPKASLAPEPGTLALLGTGLGALSMLRRRFRKL